MLGLRQRIDRTVVSLKIISKLNERDKLLFRDRTVMIQRPSIITSIQRFINGDTRDNTVVGITQLLEDTESLLNDCKAATTDTVHSGNCPLHDRYITTCRLSSSIDMAMKGLKTLRITYENDQVMQSHIESIIERFRLVLREFKKLSDAIRTSSMDDITFDTDI